MSVEDLEDPPSTLSQSSRQYASRGILMAKTSRQALSWKSHLPQPDAPLVLGLVKDVISFKRVLPNQ